MDDNQIGNSNTLKKPLLTFNWIKIIFYASCVMLVALSFRYYSPYHYKFFNSDHAIVVLMSDQFEWPRDVYYWGQNRGGSLIPFCSHILLSVVDIHPMMAVSIVLYFFLSVSAMIICSVFKSLWLKLAMVLLIFFPMNQFIMLLLLGHPYSGQMFCGTLFCLFFFIFNNRFLNSPQATIKSKLIQHILLLLSLFFFFLGIWVSEFSAIFILVPLVTFFRNPAYRNIRRSWDIFLHGVIGAIVIINCLTYFKSLVPADERYNKMFIYSFEDISRQFGYLMHNVRTTLTFDDHWVLNNWYYYFLAVVFTLIIVKKKTPLPLKTQELLRILLITASGGFILLFFSRWNFLFEIQPKYYTIVYFLVVISMLLLADYKFKARLQAALFTSILLFSFTFTYLTLVRHWKGEPFESYGDYRKLPRGTVISHYWCSYVVNAIAVDNLNSLPYDSEYVRNYNWKQEALSEKNFYFIDDNLNHALVSHDTIRQFGMNFYFTGTEYNCNSTRVKLYHPF